MTGRLGRSLLVLLLFSLAREVRAQTVIHFQRAGSGVGPALLRQALDRPHVLIVASNGEALLPSDSTYHQSVIVLGGDAIVEAHVDGDVIVVDGGLFMHPGAHIAGRAVAIGGGVYDSGLASIGGGDFAFRDFTYDIGRVPDGYALTYRSLIAARDDPFAVLALLGVAVPTYDRTNGLSVGAAPEIGVPSTSITLQPRVTYRSQLGKFDPWADLTAELGNRTELRASVGRGTFSNDSWIRPDILNSVEALLFGQDTRNYFRATRREATLSRRWTWSRLNLEPYIGGRGERADSVRPEFGAAGGPWSFFERHDSLGMLRPNPPIDAGTIGSALAGVSATWTVQDLVARLRIDEEIGAFSARSGVAAPDNRFAQTTADGRIEFPTFHTQSFSMHGHAVLTTHGSTPRQRWAYIGGSGSIPTVDMLSEGGDELLYVDARYHVPIDRVTLPLIGPPVFTIREVLGAAGAGALPALQQAIGVRLSASVLYAELLADPAHGRWHFGLGIALPHD